MKIPSSFNEFKKNPININGLEDFLCGEKKSSIYGECYFSAYADEIEQDWDEDSINLFPGMEEYALADNGYNTFLLYQEPDGKWEMVGFYSGPTICIEPDHQGKGLGTELILYTACIREGPPTADSDKQLFSEGGFAAHIKAYNLGITRGWIKESISVKLEKKHEELQYGYD